ncbi:RNA polymerase sigma factor [Flavobacterium capsici]|uniref:Sigma-70 family RNA polymerase sigma factor n=1 Tax=Flavobacterium capsici TaxID=3075618 RepID=A0AA96J3U8_9FLAO|nr:MULTISPECIES: sigma-70 family RNA polymerase sigma factor [unclassified Flavobacterium]WNM19713.1 sigma-70 family RNA polymerase sigma factor [Flavobacterium sp. PMR2A8]WNM21102.1 sigma-70 family RNA polymerase sigma factor [Flavobacterium sp. PMTSA4]
MSIEELINGCKKDDIKAQEQLYRQYAPKLFSVCLKYSRNYTEAQDNLQDGFLLVFEKIEQFAFKGSFDGWIKRVMINYILQQYRKETFLNLVHENIPEEVEIEIETDTEIGTEYLMKIIQELPDRYRLVFNLYVVDGYSHQEIADMLSINIGTSKSNLSRAKMILKEKIETLTGSKNIPSIK